MELTNSNFLSVLAGAKAAHAGFFCWFFFPNDKLDQDCFFCKTLVYISQKFSADRLVGFILLIDGMHASQSKSSVKDYELWAVY